MMVQRYAVLPGSLLSGLQVFLPGLRNGNPKKQNVPAFPDTWLCRASGYV